VSKVYRTLSVGQWWISHRPKANIRPRMIVWYTTLPILSRPWMVRQYVGWVFDPNNPKNKELQCDTWIEHRMFIHWIRTSQAELGENPFRLVPDWDRPVLMKVSAHVRN
jgi:hypothetical protein